MAEALDARAFVSGKDVFLTRSPESTVGEGLLAHELIHVVQQMRLGTPNGLQRSPASDLVNEHTSYGNLDERSLGEQLMLRAERGNFEIVTATLDALGRTDRDDVSLAFMESAPDRVLVGMSALETGRRLLDRLFDEVTSGSVGEDEQRQADRIVRLKAASIPESEFERAALGSIKLFPYRLPGLTVFSDAPISAERRAGGRIWVRQPVRVLGTSEFREEVRTLPSDVFLGGIEIPENEIIAVKMYDLGGEVHYRPAIYLVQLANQTDATIGQKIGEATALGLSLGTGSLVAAASRATWGARVLLWADRAATVLGTLTSILGEHRGWILSRLGDDGRRFVRVLDIVNSATAIYGGTRALVGMGQVIGSLVGSVQRWRAAARAAEGLSTEERQVVEQLAAGADDLIHDVQQAAAEARAERAASPRGLAGVTSEVDADVERMFAQTFDLARPEEVADAARTGIVRAAPEIAAGFSETQIAAARRLLGRSLDDVEGGVFARLWLEVENPGEVSTLTAANSRRLFDNQRKRFWNAVRNDPSARQLLLEMGAQLPSEGRAPVVRLPDGREVILSIDHIVERQEDFARALSAQNLRIVFVVENTDMLRRLTQAMRRMGTPVSPSPLP